MQLDVVCFDLTSADSKYLVHFLLKSTLVLKGYTPFHFISVPVCKHHCNGRER